MRLLPNTAFEDDKWSTFCERYGVVHSPNTVGGNVWYAGGFDGVEISRKQKHLVVSTFYGGERCHDVARIAAAAWGLWGGALHADPEIASRIAAAIDT